MSRPAKPFTVLRSEKKSHRTKAELKQRGQGEEALSTGIALKERPEVKNNPIAHKEFKRINSLLANIEKNDAIYETIINRYCQMVAECYDLEAKKNKIEEQAERLEKKLDNIGGGATFEELRSAIHGIAEIYSAAVYCDKQVQAKRKMLLDIEKENIMTIAAALRSIPKKTDKPKNKLLEALSD